MKRLLLLGFVSLAAACGGKTFPSLCANAVPPPAACATACDPAPGATNACPAGYHCGADGKCDAVCTRDGGQCGTDYFCTNDGHCLPNGDGGGGGGGNDACPAVHVTASKTTPTVELLLDQSGSMKDPYGGGLTRWQALQKALVDPTNGVVKKLAGKVIFGASLYSSKSVDDGKGKQVGDKDCPMLAKAHPRSLNNFTAISNLLTPAMPIEDTPTPDSIDQVIADFKANPPMTGSPPIILLATDGLPDTCADADPPDPTNPMNDPTRQMAANAESVAAAQRAYAAGIKLFFLFVGDVAAGDHPQRMANAGVGLDPLTGKAKFYLATDPNQLTQAFNDIVGGILSCDLKLNGVVDPIAAESGIVTLNGNVLTFGTDWNVDNDGVTLHLLGNACNTLKATDNSVIDAVFACGAVIF